MKKSKLLILSLVILAGCSGANRNSKTSSSLNDVSSQIISSSNSISTSSTSNDSTSSSITDSTSNIPSSSDSTTNSSIPSTSTPTAQYWTINELNLLIDDLEVDTKGIDVTFVGTYFSNFNETRGSYDRLMYFADETGYIYVRTTQKLAETTLKCDSSYEISGKIANNYGHYEVEMTSYKQVTDLSITALTNSEFMPSILAVHQEILKLPLDIKGTSYGKMVTVNAQYIAKMDNAVLLFYDGDNFLQVHSGNNIAFKYSPNQIGNNFLLNEHYELTGMIGEYLYKPGMQYVTATIINDVDKTYTFDNYKTIVASDIYKFAKDTDKENSDFFPYVLKMTCYVRLNERNINKPVYALVSNYNDRIYWQSASLINQSLFVRNTEDYAVIDWFYDYCDTEVQVEVYFTLYQYITNPQAWNVYVLDVVTK